MARKTCSTYELASWGFNLSHIPLSVTDCLLLEFWREEMERIQADSVAEGHEPMTSADVVSKVICASQGKNESQDSGSSLFLKNAGIQIRSTRTSTSSEPEIRMSVDELCRTYTTRVELEEVRKMTQDAVETLLEYKKKSEEEIMFLRSELLGGFPSGKSLLSDQVVL